MLRTIVNFGLPPFNLLVNVPVISVPQSTLQHCVAACSTDVSVLFLTTSLTYDAPSQVQLYFLKTQTFRTASLNYHDYVSALLALAENYNRTSY